MEFFIHLEVHFPFIYDKVTLYYIGGENIGKYKKMDDNNMYPNGIWLHVIVLHATDSKG